MYQGTAAFLTANDKSIQKHRVRGMIDNIPFSGINVLSGSMTVSNQCSDTTDSKVGAVFVGKLTMTFLKNLTVTPTSWKGRKISVVFGLCIDEELNTYEEFDIGQFYVSEATVTADGVSVVAYDAMARFDQKLPTDFIVSGYLGDIARSICSTCGVSFGMTDQEVRSLPNGDQPLGSYTPNDCSTYRDLLFWLSQTCGGFATINRLGKLVFRSYYGRSTADITIGPSKRVQGASFSDFETDFGSVVFENADGTSERIGAIGVGATYYVGMNPFLQYGTPEARNLLRTNVFNSVYSLEFTPFKVEMMSSPVFDLGDVIQFTGGIIDGTPKKGIVQSVTWQMNKGMIISGYGQNPAFQNVETASEKANSAARRSEQNSEVIYRDFVNLVPIAVTSEPVKVVDIYFTTNKVTDVEMWHEIQLQTTRASGSDQMTVQAVYTLDNVEIARKPIETFNDDAFHLLDLHYFTPVDEIGSHRWEVYLVTSGGTAAIRANDAIAVLKGQGLSKADGWTGVIILEDEIVEPEIVMLVPMISDSLVISSCDRTNPDQWCEAIVSDVITEPSITMLVDDYDENVGIYLYKPTSAVVSENMEYNLTDESGDYGVVAE